MCSKFYNIELFQDDSINEDNNEVFNKIFNCAFSFKESDSSKSDSENSFDDEIRKIYYVELNDNKEKSPPSSSEEKKLKFKKIEESSTKVSTLSKFYSLDEIMAHFDNEQIRNKLNEGRSIEKSVGYGFMSGLNKKRKRKNENINLFKEGQERTQKKRGVKGKKISEKVHTKMAPDNIIKKIKGILFKYIIIFFNLLLSKMNLDAKLVKIHHKHIEQLSRDIELKLLSLPLKDILSFEISPKFKNISENYNKKVIEEIKNSEIMLNEKNDFNYDTLMFILNISFRNWLDVFTGKDNIENIAKDYTGNQTKINFDLIKASFVGIDTLLSDFEKKNKNDNNYFALFVFYLYNYERYSILKSTRKKGNKNEK